MTPALAELLAAWQAWSRHPGDRGTAGRMADAAREAGAEVGVTAMAVYRHLADGKREGRPDVEVVESLAARGAR